MRRKYIGPEEPTIRPEFRFPPDASGTFDTVEEAQAVVDEFNSAFPGSDIYILVAASKAKSVTGEKIWKVNFHGNVNDNPAVLSWLKARGIIK